MANKITIRRVGGLLPASCLVVLILLVSVVVWLSTAGLPAHALRYIEAEAAKQGIYLKLGKLRFSPSSGLAVRARRVEFFAAPGEEKPLATLSSATFGISAGALLRGQIQPTKAEFRSLNVALPTDDGPPLMVEDASVTTVIRNGRHVRFTSAAAKLQGIPVELHGSFLLPLSGSDSSNSDLFPLNLTALLSPWQKEAGDIRRSIDGQQWQPHEVPSIDLNLTAEQQVQLSARISIPRFDKEQFHFRDALIDAEYKNNAIIINKVYFRTVEPDSEVTLQGGYDILARHLSLNLRSSAALTRMAEAIALHGVDKIHGVDMGSITAWLKRFRHPDNRPPSIILRGDVYFEENYTPKALSLTGQLTQTNFVYGKTKVDELHLSFYYKDGSFNVDRLHLAFPTGSLIFSASASSETHKGKARIIADLDIPQLLNLASEFTSEPVSLPEGLELSGNLLLDASAELEMPSFISGSTKLSQFLPALRKVELTVGIDKATHCGYVLEQPKLSLTLREPKKEENELLPHELGQALLSFRAGGIRTPAFKGAEEGLRLRKAELELDLRELSLAPTPEDDKPEPVIGSTRGYLRVASLNLPGIRIEALDAEVTDTLNIRPLAESWRTMLQQSALRLSTGAMHADDTLLGALDSKLILNANGNIDLTAVLDREGHRLHLDIHPRLTEEGLLILDEMQLELPAAGFAPLLVLTGTDISAFRMPDSMTLSGSAVYDTRGKYLQRAEGRLSIPHLVRTPGDGVAVFKGKEIPLSLYLNGKANGREGGELSFSGDLLLIHKAEQDKDSRRLTLQFTGDTASHVRLSGRTDLDVGIADQLIDLRAAHTIMRDFDTNKYTRTQVDIRDVSINWAEGLRVSASCDAKASGLGYQMNAYNDVLDTAGKPTGEERLRRDFGKNPFRRLEKGTAHVDVLYHTDAEGNELASYVAIRDADVTYDNRPWLRQNGFKNGVNFTRLQGEEVLINIKDSFVELRNVHGKAYPAYAIGAYYDDLPGFMEGIVLERPATLNTQHCVFPYSKTSKARMSGNILMKAGSVGYTVADTTFPLNAFSGFIWFAPGKVGLDRLNAACWEGAVDSAIIIDYSGKSVGFDGYVNLHNINLKPLAAAYGSEQSPALCNGAIRFRTPSTNLRDLQAYGNVHIVNGELMNLRIFRPVGALIADLPGNLAALERSALNNHGMKATWIDRQIKKFFKKTGELFSSLGESISKVASHIPFANHFLSYDLQELHSDFTINKGHLVTQNFHAVGNNLNVGLRLDVNLSTLRVEGDLWPKISSIPTIILAPITFLSDFMIDIRIHGPLDDIDWKFGLNRRNKDNADDCTADETSEQSAKNEKF